MEEEARRREIQVAESRRNPGEIQVAEEQEKVQSERGRPERRKTQRIEYGRGVDEEEEERKRLEKELKELNMQQLEEEKEEKSKGQDESDRQSVILEMIGGLRPPSGSRARSMPRGRRREKVADSDFYY